MVLDLVKSYVECPERVVLVSGGCPKGGDAFAEDAAKVFGIPIDIFPVQEKGDSSILSKHEFREKAYARNTLIAKHCDVLYALVEPGRKGGTEDTIKKAQALGKPVFLVDVEGKFISI